MAAGRDPIDRVVDLLVAVPVCSAIAARESIALATRLVRHRSVADRPRRSTRPASVVDVDLAEADLMTDADVELPIEGYDHLAARQVVDRLAGLGPEELAAIEQHELAHRHRSTVLGRIAQLTS